MLYYQLNNQYNTKISVPATLYTKKPPCRFLIGYDAAGCAVKANRGDRIRTCDLTAPSRAL